MKFLNAVKEKAEVTEVNIDMIISDYKLQNDFEDSEISELAGSVMKNGILQPLSIKRCGEKFEVISGRKRLIVARMCGLVTVPCIIHESHDINSDIAVLVDNIKNKDLSFFEEAEAIEKLITYYGLTQEDAASKLGKAQSTIANKLRLLRLTPEERKLIIKSGLTERHARALLKLASIPDRMCVIEKIIKNNLNVEQTEKLIDDYIGNQREKSSYKKRSKVFHNVKAFINTINKTVDMMKLSGIQADTKKIQNDDYIEYHIIIPVQKTK